MTFTTVTFLVFAAAVFAAYWLIGERRWQNLLLVVVSYAFYGWWDARLGGLIAASTAIDFLVGRALDGRSQHRRALLWISIVTNLTLLGVFKYYGFFVDSLVAAAAAVGFELHPPTLRLVLPVGVSFYTFQTLGTTIDVYRGRLRACRDPIAYAAYVAFFPQLVAGPIERGERLLPQFAEPRRFDPDAARAGLRQALWGFVQKVALADNLAILVDDGYTGVSRGPLALVATIAFALQIYWDFAGYSNIAIGTARTLGFTLTRNFDYPYFSRSLAEFWRRWHISLSSWFRDYVYVPLGGARQGKARQALAVVVTFSLSGLWHGASWTFVIWGAGSGALAAWSILRGRAARGGSVGSDGRWPSLGDLARMAATFACVCLGWVFFRAEDVGHALGILRAIARDAFDPAAWAMLETHGDYLRGVLPLVAIVLLIEWITRRHDHALVLEGWPRTARWALYTVLVWSTLYVMREDPTQFVYFQF